LTALPPRPQVSQQQAPARSPAMAGRDAALATAPSRFPGHIAACSPRGLDGSPFAQPGSSITASLHTCPDRPCGPKVPEPVRRSQASTDSTHSPRGSHHGRKTCQDPRTGPNTHADTEPQAGNRPKTSCPGESEVTQIPPLPTTRMRLEGQVPANRSDRHSSRPPIMSVMSRYGLGPSRCDGREKSRLKVANRGYRRQARCDGQRGD
jgi:hypothetical protein